MSQLVDIFRSEFELALTDATARALAFSGADVYMDNLFGLIFKANFQHWHDEDFVADFYQLIIDKSQDHVADVMDFLHEFNVLFYGSLRLHGVEGRADQLLAEAFGQNAYEPQQTPGQYHQAYKANPNTATFLAFISGNPWLRAILWIRFLGLRQLLKTSGREEEGKR